MERTHKKLISKINVQHKVFNFWMGIARYAQKKAAIANMNAQVLTEQARKVSAQMITTTYEDIENLSKEIESE
jgi:hypothetical protein